jgi:prophage regulatory protein
MAGASAVQNAVRDRRSMMPSTHFADTEGSAPPPPLLDGQDRLLRLEEVIKLISVSRATIYRHLGTGSFPAPVRVGLRRIAWRASDINNWFAQLQTA